MFARSEPDHHGGFVSPPSLSRYRPIAQIGRGNTAEVILAERHGGGGTELAVLRRLWPDRAADLASLAAFLEAARLAERLRHPNVVHTHERLEDGARPAVAMEYLDGQPLAEVMRRLAGSNTLGLTLRLRIVTHVLSALHYAHQLRDDRGRAAPLVHGQVGPSSVFVTYAGQVKVLGLGRRAPAAGAPRSLENLAYLAPEQLRGDAAGSATDTFAAGVMLWEMAARRRRWEGMSDADIFGHLSRRIPVPPLGGASQFPSALIKICARAVDPEPTNRYTSAAELATELTKMLPRPEEADERHLGKVVSLAFGAEREARRAAIDLNRASDFSTLEQPPVVGPRVVVTPPPPTPGTPWPVGPKGLASAPRGRVAAPPPPSLSWPLPTGRRARISSGTFNRLGWLSAGVALAVTLAAVVLWGASIMRGWASPVATAPAVLHDSANQVSATPTTSAPEQGLASAPVSTPAPLAQPIPAPCCAAKQEPVTEQVREPRQEHHPRRASSSGQPPEALKMRSALTAAPDDDVLPPSLDLGRNGPRPVQPLRRSPPQSAAPKARPIDVADPFSEP